MRQHCIPLLDDDGRDDMNYTDASLEGICFHTSLSNNIHRFAT